MPQIELSEQNLQKVDNLVKEGVFSNRNQVIRTSLESLLQLSTEEIKNMEKAKHNASMFLEIYMGDMLYVGMPVKVIIGGKELYKVPVKSASDKSLHFYLHADPNTLEVNAHFLTDLRSLPEMSDEKLEEMIKVQTEANLYCQKQLGNKLVVGIPLRDALEGDEGFTECFRIPLMGKYEDKTYISGYLFLDVKTLTALDCTIFGKYEKI